MTISSTTRTAGPFTGNGITTTFAFSFKVFQASDLQLVRTTTATGVSTTLVINSDYTVSLNANQNSAPGGSVTLTTALATGQSLIVTSSIDALQTTDLTNQGGFYPTVITNALDKITILIQQILGSIGRTLQFPISDSNTYNRTLPSASLRANNYLAFDSNGNVISTPGTSSSTPISLAMTPVVQATTTTEAASAMGVLPLTGGALTGPLSATSFTGAHEGTVGATTPSTAKFLHAHSPEITITDGASLAWNTALGQVAKVTLGGSRTFAAPTNLQTGAFYSVFLIQDATGSRTVSWNTVFAFTGGTAPALSTAANAVDQIAFRYDGTKLREVGRSLGTA
jgi:hypothetical protein